MSDVKLFRLTSGTAEELVGQPVKLEHKRQALIERHIEKFLHVRFLASEYSTGKTHSGRIDTLGIDENGCPVIIEYKRSTNENVINQGLFYLDWLMDHKAEVELLVLKKYGKEAAETIEWSSPRLLCIAGDFTRYDEHAVQQINRNIELFRYKRYGSELLLLELVNAVTASPENDGGTVIPPTNVKYKTVSEYLEEADVKLQDLFESLKAYLLGLGDDVQMKTLKFYFAFKRIRNFAAVEVRTKALMIHVKTDPKSVTLEKGFTRDVSNVGHFGTGDLEITLKTLADLEKAKPLFLASYEAS